MTDKPDCPPQVTDNLPRDATGKAIPFETKRLYGKSGRSFDVLELAYTVNTEEWRARLFANAGSSCRKFYLDPSDSWERLLGDLDRSQKGLLPICTYLIGDRGANCSECISTGSHGGCSRNMLADIARRIRALRKVDENDD